MYIPEHFEVTDVRIMHDLIRAHPLATVVTHSANGLNANPIPLSLLADPAPYGLLQGHVSRLSPLLADLTAETESLVIFHGPNAYISPSWYATKKQTGKVVPTWNYVVVHAYGILRIIDDPQRLRAQLEALTNHNEAPLPEPWTVADAPAEFTDKLLTSIIGIEMKITRLIGKWKVSQNQPHQNQDSVINGLTDAGGMDATKMAEWVRHAPVK